MEIERLKDEVLNNSSWAFILPLARKIQDNEVSLDGKFNQMRLSKIIKKKEQAMHKKKEKNKEILEAKAKIPRSRYAVETEGFPYPDHFFPVDQHGNFLSKKQARPPKDPVAFYWGRKTNLLGAAMCISSFVLIIIILDVSNFIPLLFEAANNAIAWFWGFLFAT